MRKWSRKEQVGRVLWALANPLFSLSPRRPWGWRRFMLRLFGAKVGANVQVYPSVRVAIPWHLDIAEDVAVGDRACLYSLGQVTIGARTTISQNAHICAGTHEWRVKSMPLVKAPITIGQDCWICADAFVGPNVTIGDSAIVAARAVVVKNVAASVMVGGNPAQPIQKALRD